MITTTIAKSILSKSLLTHTTKAVHSTGNMDKFKAREKKRERELKPYEKLFYSSPLMNINIEMILAINELRPKATYIIAIKNGQFPKQISNSTHNIVECLHYIQGFKYFYKSFPPLIENITKVLNEKIEFYATGLHKVNAIKKLVLMISNIDSLYGQAFTELMAVYLIWGMESSLKIKQKLVDDLAPLKQRLAEINHKKEALLQKCSNDQTKLSQQDKQTFSGLNKAIYFIKNEINDLIYQNKFLKEQDFLCGLYYCLQHGYYSETVIKQFIENILERDNYSLPEFQYFLKDEEEFFNQKPFSNIQNKRALIFCRMYSSAVYRIKILNQLKKMKKQDGKFMDFLKQQKNLDQNKHSESSSQESPFINGASSGIDETFQSSSQQKTEFVSDKLIEESLISKKNYTNLVSRYIELLQRKDALCYILSEQTTSQSLRVLQTEFFSYMNEANQTLTISNIKSRYLNVFKEIFNVQKNGTIYLEAPLVEATFEVILKMYDYGDRKEIFELLKLYERHLVTKNVSELKSVVPFYVFEKYNYKSNFVASKLFEFINLKYRFGRQQFIIKEELILICTEVCRYLSLYFKLLESDFSSLLTQHNSKMRSSKIFDQPNQKVNQSSIQLQNKTGVAKYQQQFNQAVEIFLNNYNKMISIIYLDRDNSKFIGKGLELSFEHLRAKYLNTKAYEQNLHAEGKVSEEDIIKIIIDSSESIKAHRDYVKNIYQKEFHTKFSMKSPTGTDTTITSLSYNPYIQAMFIKKGPMFNPLDQIVVVLDIVQTAIQLQTMKKMQFYQDVFVVFKSIFENKKLVKLLTHHQMFPEILKKLIKISHVFKGSYKNESNKLFQSILNLTAFNLNNFLHNARINIAREIINADKSVPLEQSFQPYLQNLEINLNYEHNIRLWSQPTYQINKQTVINHIRSDIINSVLSQNSQLEKIIRDQLAKIKTIKPNQKIKNIKFQLNYLEYPYLANVAINKNNELIVVLVRRTGADYDKPYNAVINNYYNECENYFRKKGNKVIMVSNESQIRNSLRDLTK